jgi:hypothetical protein
LLLNPTRDPITVSPPQPRVRPEELADRKQALHWFQAERPVLLAAIGQAASSGFSAHAWQLPWTATTFFPLARVLAGSGGDPAVRTGRRAGS